MITQKMIGEYVKPVALKYPVKRVILFGSYARGEATEKSDIDLVVDCEGKLIGLDFFGVAGEIYRALPVKADIFELREIKKPSVLYDNIVREGVVIYDRE